MKNGFSKILKQVGLFTNLVAVNCAKFLRIPFFYRTPLVAALWFESEGDATEYLQYA